jgi:hypothetical protein
VALASDRGAIITVTAGHSWSSLLNQPTGQFADVVTDSAFPYRICGAERVSPPGCLPSRVPGGGIPASAWQSVATAVGRAVAPDAQDAEVVYSGNVSRFDRRTQQSQHVRIPPDADEPAGPLVFSADGRTLYYGGRAVWRGAGGLSWSLMSPELSRPGSDAPHGISSLGPSTVDARILWAGTEDGSVQVTRDGGTTWAGVIPADLAPGSRISSVEPSHFDVNTAYVSAVAARLGDDGPHLWRTRDGGASWQPIVNGLPPRARVHGVREDAFRRGLLFAATERSIFVSFDDGDTWQSLRLNLPPVPITDLAIKDADLVVSTDGRGLWVLDDMSPFRQITADLARSSVVLFRPAGAWRTRPAPAADPSVPGDEPSGANPPDGVAISYLIGGPSPSPPVTIEIIETLTGDVIQRFTPSTAPGFHRLMWDLRYTPLDGRSIWVLPGTYQVRLTAGPHIARQAVIVRMDPRVRTSTGDLTLQFKTSRAVYERRRRLSAALERLQDTPAERERAAALRRAAADVNRALDLLQHADVRPSADAEAAATSAMASADAALGTE